MHKDLTLVLFLGRIELLNCALVPGLVAAPPDLRSLGARSKGAASHRRLVSACTIKQQQRLGDPCHQPQQQQQLGIRAAVKHACIQKKYGSSSFNCLSLPIWLSLAGGPSSQPLPLSPYLISFPYTCRPPSLHTHSHTLSRASLPNTCDTDTTPTNICPAHSRRRTGRSAQHRLLGALPSQVCRRAFWMPVPLPWPWVGCCAGCCALVQRSPHPGRLQRPAGQGSASSTPWVGWTFWHLRPWRMGISYAYGGWVGNSTSSSSSSS